MWNCVFPIIITYPQYGCHLAPTKTASPSLKSERRDFGRITTGNVPIDYQFSLWNSAITFGLKYTQFQIMSGHKKREYNNIYIYIVLFNYFSDCLSVLKLNTMQLETPGGNHCCCVWTQVALLIILLHDQWKKAKEANAKKAKEPTKNPKEAHD